MEEQIIEVGLEVRNNHFLLKDIFPNSIEFAQGL